MVMFVERPGRHHMFGYASGSLSDDLAAIDAEATFVAVTAPVRSRARLSSFRRAEVWWILDGDQALVEELAELVWIRRLYLLGATLHDIRPLSRLRALETLTLDGCLKLRSLAGLERLSSLMALNLRDVRHVHALDPLGDLSGLRALAVQGGVWNDMKVESLAPLDRLSAVEELDLAGLRVTDESLRPLEGLTALRRLTIDGRFPTEEFARLAGILPDVACAWFSPYVPQTTACERCGGPRVMLTGKRRGVVCQRCHTDRLQRHVENFERLRRAAAR
jgi:hypothetical protein